MDGRLKAPFTMGRGPRSVQCILACALLGLAGCASTRGNNEEPPPEVAPQPPPITAGQAAAEGEQAAQAVPAAPATTRLTASRSRPTDRSIDEIRRQRETAAAPLDFPQRLDHLHDRIYTWTQGLVEATDHRFAAKDKELKPVPAAPFRLGVVVESLDRSDGMDFDLDVDLDVSLNLPNIEERLRIFVTSDELDETPRGAGADPALRAGLRYQFVRNLNFDIGVQLDVPPVAFASVKWTRQINLGRWQFYPLLKLFAETDESVGYAAAATFDRWSGRHLLRSSTFAKWRNDRDRTQWSQTFIYARAHEVLVPDRYGYYLRADDIGRGWGVRLLAGGEETSAVTRYEAGVFYRRPARLNNWLYWYVEPVVRWDREYRWDADPGIRFGIHALFWDLARPAR